MTKHFALKAVTLAAAGAAVLVLAARRYMPVKVEGPSMLPMLRPGDRLIVDRRARPAAGDVVVARRPDGIAIVKRVRAIDDDGIWLEGDNQAMSTDWRRIGPLATHSVSGVAVARYSPLRRAAVGHFRTDQATSADRRR